MADSHDSRVWENREEFVYHSGLLKVRFYDAWSSLTLQCLWQFLTGIWQLSLQDPHQNSLKAQESFFLYSASLILLTSCRKPVKPITKDHVLFDSLLRCLCENSDHTFYILHIHCTYRSLLLSLRWHCPSLACVALRNKWCMVCKRESYWLRATQTPEKQSMAKVWWVKQESFIVLQRCRRDNALR